MKELSTFRFRPTPIPEGGFTFDFVSTRSAEAYVEDQLACTNTVDRTETLEQRNTWILRTDSDEIRTSAYEDVVDRNTENTEELVRPSDLAVKDAKSFASQDHNFEIESRERTDLTGPFHGKIQEGDYGDTKEGVSSLTSDDQVRSKDVQNSDDSNYFIAKSQSNFKDLGYKASGRSYKTSSKPVPASVPSCTLPKSESSNTNLITTLSTSSIPTPTALDPLCYLMAKTSFRASESKFSQRIMVPRAYKHSMSTEPKCHYDKMAVFQAGTGRRGPSGTKRKRGDLGFKPDEVIKKGALHTATLDVVCSLEGDVHQIFEERHWTDCPNQVYEALKPALLLATKLLNTSQCLQHFQTAWKGKRVYCFETSFRKQKKCYRIREDVPLTPKSIEELKEHINAMAGTITFQFLDSRITSSPDHANRYFATAKMVPCNHSSCSVSTDLRTTKLQTTIISMHPDFYVQAQKLCRLQYPDPAQALRFQFFFAVNLMHEFAHAFEIACSPKETSIGNEVHMYDWLEAESGRQWETNVFGGFVTSINARADSLHGLCVLEWPEPGLRDPSRLGLTDIWAVPMAFVQGVFRESFWEDVRKKGVGDKSLLNVPRTGATSVGVASFTTARFEDVLVDRELGCLELALREVEAWIQCSLVDSDDEEQKQTRLKRRRVYVPQSWMKSIGRRGGM